MPSAEKYVPKHRAPGKHKARRVPSRALRTGVVLTGVAAAVIEALKGHPLFAHVTLTRSERSPIAALVTEMLENVTL